MQLEVELPKRQVSHGTVWTVGGTIPRISFDESQHEGRSITQEPTPVRNFAMTLALSKQSAGENRQRYLDRVAKALDIDRLRKTFNFTLNSFPHKDGQKPDNTEKTEWNGYSWTSGAGLAGMTACFIENLSLKY